MCRRVDRCEYSLVSFSVFFFFQAEDGIRDLTVTGVQTCALPISYAVFCLKKKKKPTNAQIEHSIVYNMSLCNGESKDGRVCADQSRCTRSQQDNRLDTHASKRQL